MKQVILASHSPRRKEILEQLGIRVRVIVPAVQEKSRAKSADVMVRELSLQKATAVAALLQEQGEDLSETLIIAADTAVVHQLEILGKPKNKNAAVQMLQRLRNSTHFVTTGITLLWGQKTLCENELTKVHVAHMTDREIEAYVASGEPMDKAGGYGIQGTASLWIEGIEGDYFNVVGFPVHRFHTMLQQWGLTEQALSCLDQEPNPPSLQYPKESLQ